MGFDLTSSVCLSVAQKPFQSSEFELVCRHCANFGQVHISLTEKSLKLMSIRLEQRILLFKI